MVENYRRSLNDLALCEYGKFFSDLTPEERTALKQHPSWHYAAYGLSGAEFKRTINRQVKDGKAQPE